MKLHKQLLIAMLVASSLACLAAYACSGITLKAKDDAVVYVLLPTLLPMTGI